MCDAIYFPSILNGILKNLVNRRQETQGKKKQRRSVRSGGKTHPGETEKHYKEESVRTETARHAAATPGMTAKGVKQWSSKWADDPSKARTLVSSISRSNSSKTSAAPDMCATRAHAA